MTKDSVDFYRQKLIANEPFSDEDVNGFLKAYHAMFFGATFTEYGHYKTDKGVMTYELLAQTVKAKATPIGILDLACGDGPLSEVLLKKFKNRIQILAVDMSKAELLAAQNRLSRFKNIEFLETTADKLQQSSNSFDYVLCHMALMLMRPIDKVFAEIGRVLKPGGTFAAIIPFDGSSSKEYDHCYEIMNEVLKEYIPHYFKINLGIGEIFTKEGIEKLVSKVGCFNAPQYVDFNMIERDTPQKHYELFSEYYGPPFLPEEGKAKLKQKMLTYLESIKDAEGKVTILSPLRKVSFVKRFN